MTPALLRTFYESPFVVACGPLASALLAGYAALDLMGRPYLTAAGLAYLRELDRG
ncbi:hypothetical protein ACRAVF_19305 [Bradyrhizobium oligotrophicum S58]